MSRRPPSTWAALSLFALSACALHPSNRVNAPAQTWGDSESTVWEAPIETEETAAVVPEDVLEDEEVLTPVASEQEAAPVDPQPAVTDADLDAETTPASSPMEEPEVVAEEQVPVATEEAWEDPQLVGVKAYLGATLIDPDDVPLGVVQDFLLDPQNGAVLGLVLSATETQPSAFVPFAGIRSLGEGKVVLTEQASLDLASERRDLAFAELFRGRELERFEGKVAEITRLNEDGDFESFTLVDDNNHRHRVFLAPSSVAATVPLAEEGTVRLQALRTRDEDGPLLITSWIAVEGADEELVEIPLRDEKGQASWTRGTPQGWLLDELVGRYVKVDGQEVGAIHDVTIRPSDGVIEQVKLDGQAEGVTFGWQDMQPGDGSGLVLDPEVWLEILDRT